MRKIREVLRLRHAHGLSQRAIGNSLRLSTGAVNMCLGRARRAGLSWPLPPELGDAQLERLLYPPPPAVAVEQRPVPGGGILTPGRIASEEQHGADGEGQDAGRGAV
jgi:hypothetical protein